MALPRSRSYWLSRYLNYGGWTCGHDQVRYVRSPEDVKSWLSLDDNGTVETAAAPFWRLLVAIRPDARIVVIRRPIEAVFASLVRTDVIFNRESLMTLLRRHDRKLDQIERFGALSIRFDDLNDAATRAHLFKFCTGLPHDPAWDERIGPVNLQINLPAELSYLRANAPQLRLAEALCARRIRSILRPPRMGDPDAHGISIQEEPFATVWKDAESLMAEHCIAVGDEPDAWKAMNVPAMLGLADRGAMLCITARCNGRLLGYLGSILSPSLLDARIMQATQLGPFVCQDAGRYGLGRRMTSAAIAAAESRGARQVHSRAGVRGDGPRLANVYRRLGFQEDGQLFRKDLAAA